jgi:hypothetical protein
MNAREVLINTAHRLSQRGAWSHYGWGNGGYWSPLTEWNNAKEKTQEEVVAALMGASELYDKEHVHEEELVEV